MSLAGTLIKAPIHLYRWTLKPYVGWNCRHLPTCSEYALEAIDKNGAWRGLLADGVALVALPSVRYAGAGPGARPYRRTAYIGALALRPLALARLIEEKRDAVVR